MKEAAPEYFDVNSQVLQDVALRVDRAFQAYFRRLTSGEKSGSSAFAAEAATTASPIRSAGTMVARTSTMGSSCERNWAELWRAGLARLRVPPRPSRSAGRWMGGLWPSPALIRLYSRRRPPARRQASTWDWRRSPGTRIFNPGCYRKAERAENRAAPGLAAQEGEQSAAQACEGAGESASDGAPPATGLPVSDGARSGAHNRCNLS
jgi:hypothetical protein